MLTRSHGRVIKSHPGHLPLLHSRLDLKFCENFCKSQTQRRVNAFYYVLEITSRPEPPCCFFGIEMPEVQLGSAWAAIEMAVKSAAKIDIIF